MNYVIFVAGLALNVKYSERTVVKPILQDKLPKDNKEKNYKEQKSLNKLRKR